MTIIGISGLAGAGKDTAARTLEWHRGFVKVSLADPMKRFCQELFGFSMKQLWGPSEYRNEIDPRWGISPRHALQQLGTEWGRAVHLDVWVRYAIRASEKLIANGIAGVVIPDVRFKNERDAIRAAGGKVWRIVRPGAGLSGVTSTHSSENDLTDADCDVVIQNDASLVELARRVRAAAQEPEPSFHGDHFD